ncbi:hypothetical protein LTR56_019881 [Elasticomyces elasticus]|nr:hypothetical protein LTR56_019881 [Elasticomyces elasticus]KAK3642335.1 hypothetical protein LTR22_016149 [Elasticomyces elasticus]KAK4914410.1 hypothetical protein LTR49_017329 [Elasticomyces elasticus]KAK5760386.1 hypothetical protein LTS12_009429 [Elasticomyces elasticus]
MKPSWDDSPDDADQIDFEGTDAELWKHLPKLVDGVTKGKITDATRLVALYQYQDSKTEVDNELLKNLTGVSRPQVPCQLVLADGQRMPPKVGDDKCPYALHLNFNKLLLAPVVRLTCTFLRSTQTHESGRKSPFKVVLEWHFNDYDGKKTGITDYNHDDAASTISFSAGSATCSGITNLEPLKGQFKDEEDNIFKLIKSFLAPGRHELKSTSPWAPRLPGGCGKLLPTIGPKVAEYAAFDSNPDRIQCVEINMRKLATTLRGDNKHPMVPMECANTFSTVKEAGVQLAYSAMAAESEAQQAMRLWAGVNHKAKVFQVGEYAVLGVRFRPFKKLGSVNDEVIYRLPKDLSATVFFMTGGQGVGQVKAVLMGSVSELPTHEAFFRIISHTPRGLGAMLFDAQYLDVSISPVYISATYRAQLATINRLQLPSNKRWHGILLNQVHDALETIDLTTPKDRGAVIPPHTKHAADEWLSGWLTWNEEQLSVIKGIKAAKGGCVVVMGPAGTGKTLLQQALSIYFYLLGFHVLALAPANSNVDHLAVQLGKIKARESLAIPLNFIRMYTSLRDINPQDNPEEIGDEVKSAKQKIVELYDLLTALEDQEVDKGAAREWGLAQAVLHAAENKTHRLMRRPAKEKGEEVPADVDAWNAVREVIRKWRAGGEEREELRIKHRSEEMMPYRKAYGYCRAQLISENRFILATTGNVRSAELYESWYSSEAMSGVKRIGVIVFVDEAAKDVEANVWTGVVCEKWSHGVKGFIMLGDNKQLKPTNTCANGKVDFNAFNHRLDIPLPCRLVEEGFPHYRLLEQRRMHKSISRFPNNEFYNGKLRNGPGMSEPLDRDFPRLGDVLKSIVAEGGSMPSLEQRRYWKSHAEDEDARLHWVEVKGERVQHPASTSICVKEHTEVFMGKILPRLITYFKTMGLKLNDHVMVICAYSYALHEYLDAIRRLLNRVSDLTSMDMPQVLTVDSSQGQEATIVFFDGSSQHSDQIGFMKDEGRCNVAMTRATEVFWMIGGSMSIKFPRNKDLAPSPLPRYRNELDLMMRCHSLTA